MQKDNFIRFAAGAVFLWFLFGCTLGPDFEEPNLYSDKQIEQALDLQPASQNAPDTYRIFNDSVLNRLLDMAVANSPTVRAALGQVKQARLSVRIAEVQGLPTFNASMQHRYVNESRSRGYLFEEDLYQAGLDATWELDIFGGVRRRTEAAVASAYAVIANLQNVYVSLTAQVALAYVSLRQAQADLSLLQKSLKAQQGILKHTISLRASGLVSQDELNKAQIAVQSIKSDIASRQTQIEQFKNQLSLLTGQLPQSLDTLLAEQKKTLVERKFAFNVNRFFNLPADVIEKRPDVDAAAYALMAQNAEVGAAIADLYPKISLAGLLGFQSLHADKLFNHKSYAYSLTPTLSIPLFYFGQLKNQVEIQREKYQESFANYENTFLTVAQEIKDALVMLQGAERQYDAAEKSLAQMENVYRLAEQRRQAGLTTQIDLEEVYLNLLSARRTWIDANSAMYLNSVRFFKAVGVDI